MDREVIWQVCVDGIGPFEMLASYESRQEAERAMRALKRNWPEAFLVRQTLERMDRRAPLRLLTFPTAEEGQPA